MTDTIDPITLAVLAGRMEQIADEMDATLFRAAFNPIIAEAHDASHGLYHALSGDTLVQGKSGLPIFVGVMSFAVKAVIDKAAENGDLEDGDIYIFNDAHLGGTHLSDMRLVRPYFHDGKLFCYLASVGHWHDVGGAVPGNYNPAATDAFQEAFVLPPVRLAKAGTIQTDIIDILMRNTRLPQSAQGDLNGQLGALDLGVKRLDELLTEYGAETALPTAVATAYVAIKHIFPGLPANAGVMRPIDVKIPEGSLLSAPFPAPVGGYTETILRMIDVIFAAASQAAPDRVVANAYGTINALSISGKRANGQPWVMFSFYGGGHGGSIETDGLNHGNAPISTATIPPMEILEAAYPVMFKQWALRPDSAGAGMHRGGMGATYEIEVLEESATAFLFGERGRFAPKGAAGGGDAAMNVFAYEQADGWHPPPMASKMVGIKLQRGQSVRLDTPGGGGYGPAADRAASNVAKDVAGGLLTPEHATLTYGNAWKEVTQ